MVWLFFLALVLAAFLGFLWQRERRRRKQLQQECSLSQAQLSECQQALHEAQESMDIKAHDDNNSFLGKLATGWYELEEDVHADMARYKVSFPADSFCVAVVQIEDRGSQFLDQHGALPKDGRIVADYVIGRQLHQVSVPELWLRGFTVANRIVVLACPLTQEEQFYRVLTQQLSQVRQALEEQYSILVSFGISQIYPGVMGISKAYAQAREVLDYKQMLGIDSCCLLWKDASHGMAGKQGPIIGLEKERQILKCIEIGDYASMETQIRQLIDQEFELAQPSIEIFRLRYYGLCNLLLNVMHEFVSVTGQRLDVTRETMDQVFQATNVADLKGAVTEVLDQVVRQLQADKQRAQPQWIVTMIDQIYQRYQDPNLSAAVLAAELHLNPTYAARIFKQHTGKGIYEYIHWVRIEAATILLKENVPVKSVAATVGYCDAASLSRVFKKYTGTTPSSYQAVRSVGTS